MTKPSSIMVCPIVHLPTVMSDSDRDVMRRILLDGIKGIDAVHDRRWRRYIGTLINSEPGEVTEFLNPRTRSLPFHKRWMAIERAFFENQDAYVNLHRFRDWLKVGAGWGKYEATAKGLVFVPGSVSFEKASDDEMREFVRSAEEFLRTPRATRKLWPHLKAAGRSEMVETLLRNPQEQEQT